MGQTLLLSVLLSQLCLPASLDLVYRLIAEPMTWFDAQTHCRQHYLDLATVRDVKDLKGLKAAANGLTDAWIGLRRTSDNVFDGKWYWSQPTVKYSETEPWDRTQPNNVNENCGIAVKNGPWHDGPCGCSNTNVLVTEPRSWVGAQQFCRRHHTDLMSGKDQRSLLDPSTLPHQWCFVGLFWDQWGWSDGSESSFRNWNSDVNPHKCAALRDEGLWESDDCGLKKSFICHIGNRNNN
uniref:C-type lectin domain-containing protein n=1 Tax=Knipowitschia caucasica TaxID=637954 RepID=A0AAV2MMM4_KNICA